MTTSASPPGSLGDLVLQRGPTLALAAANLWVAVPAVLHDWPLGELMWSYWAQSVIIGLVHSVAIVSLRDFEPGDFQVFGKPVGRTRAWTWLLAVLFLLHYGFMHAVFLGFLAFEFDSNPIEYDGFVATAAAFAASHVYAFLARRRELTEATPDLGTLFFFPYLRILPMHLTILLGFGVIGAFGGARWIAGATLLFIGLRTVADVAMDRVEARVMLRKAGTAGRRARRRGRSPRS